MRSAGIAVVLALTVAHAGAAQGIPSGRDREPSPLFRSDQPLAITLTADFRGGVLKDRDTLSDKRFPATLAWRSSDGDSGTFRVLLSTRGHSRLLPVVCDFVPLRVHFPDSLPRPPLFEGPRSLKLSVNCKPKDAEYRQYVLQEYLIYRSYQLFTDWSYGTRMVTATYVQEGSRDTIAVTPSFFVEHDSDVARRNGGTLFEQPGVRFGDVDSTTMLRVALFEYMVGNTDWALPLLHNVRVVRVDPGFYYPVPYDFDFSGLIKTRYARPSQKLPITSVRQRLWRGPCASMESLRPLFAEFTARKDTLLALHRDFAGLDPKRAASTVEYLDDFFRVITNPKKAEPEFRYVCG
jgi:hypothetical protein